MVWRSLIWAAWHSLEMDLGSYRAYVFPAATVHELSMAFGKTFHHPILSVCSCQMASPFCVALMQIVTCLHETSIFESFFNSFWLVQHICNEYATNIVCEMVDILSYRFCICTLTPNTSHLFGAAVLSRGEGFNAHKFLMLLSFWGTTLSYGIFFYKYIVWSDTKIRRGCLAYVQIFLFC